jgi:hypothetical protein
MVYLFVRRDRDLGAVRNGGAAALSRVRNRELGQMRAAVGRADRTASAPRAPDGASIWIGTVAIAWIDGALRTASRAPVERERCSGRSRWSRPARVSRHACPFCSVNTRNRASDGGGAARINRRPTGCNPAPSGVTVAYWAIAPILVPSGTELPSESRTLLTVIVDRRSAPSACSAVRSPSCRRRRPGERKRLAPGRKYSQVAVRRGFQEHHGDRPLLTRVALRPWSRR